MFVWKTKFERLLHQALVLNELGTEAVAFRLSWAGTKESGYSYGFAQFDLAAGAALHRRRLLAILRDAAEPGSDLEAVLPRLQVVLPLRVGEMSTAQRRLIDDNTTLINDALGGDKGKTIIEQSHREHLAKLIGQVNPLREVAIDEARAFIRSVAGRVYIADYCNQFGAPNTFARYLQGKPVRIGGKRHTLTAPLNAEIWRRYIMSTKYAQNHPADIERGLGNIASVIGEDSA